MTNQSGSEPPNMCGIMQAVDKIVCNLQAARMIDTTDSKLLETLHADAVNLYERLAFITSLLHQMTHGDD